MLCCAIPSGLAEELNISTDHLGKLELGRRGVSIDLLIDISNALHVTLDYLIKEKLMDAESDMTAQQTQEILDLLENGPDFLDTFDAELFGELVDKIIVESNDFIRFCLKNGLELRERIERTVR